MALKYYINRLVINKKGKHTQETTWSEQKQIIFNIIQELQPKVLYKKSENKNGNYNILNNYNNEDKQSLCVLPTEEKGNLYKQDIFTHQLKNLSPLTPQNYINNSNRFIFYMCLIDNDNTEIFKEGIIDQIYDQKKDENSGILNRTLFGIYLDDISETIYIIKQSGYKFIGIKAFEDYLKAKSNIYNEKKQTQSFNFIPLPSKKTFERTDINQLKEVYFEINNEVLSEYIGKSGRRDAFVSIIVRHLPRGLRIGKKVGIKLKIGPEGDQNVVDLFNAIYTSFNSEHTESIAKLMNGFAIRYDSQNYGNNFSFNFKREQKFFYEVEPPTQGNTNHIKNLNDAFINIVGSEDNE